MSNAGHEFTGRSVEAAIAEGLRQLGLNREEVDVEILNEGRRGLLGIGATDARVRIVPLAASEPPRSSAPAAAASTSTQAATSPATAEPTSAVAPTVTDPMAKGAAPATVAQEDFASAEEAPAAAKTTEIEKQELERLAADLLREMLQHMGVPAQVVSSWQRVPEDSERKSDESQLVLDIQGKDLGVLIGRQGETLASIQYLLRLMVNQKLHLWTNIVVDVEQYKQRRADRLDQMAQRLAEQVVQTGKPVVLEPMSPSDRRLVHLALRDHPRVFTKSIGEGDRRKVQILLHP